jgi:hypothetical protein
MTVSMRGEFLWPDLPRALHEQQPWGRPGIEPPLSEVLADPIVQAVMRRDGVSLGALKSVIAHVLPWVHQAPRSGSSSPSAPPAGERRLEPRSLPSGSGALLFSL